MDEWSISSSSIVSLTFAANAWHLLQLAGLLLRDIKDFWRAALLLSMLLYPTDIYSATSSFEFDKRREVYNMVEEAILGKGMVALCCSCSYLWISLNI